jgi:signal transduction histidine kinase
MMSNAATVADDRPTPLQGPDPLERLRSQHEALLRKVSHDLRTPLVALTLQAQILERSLGDSDPNRQRVATIIALTREFTALLGRIVETARLEAGIAKLDAARIVLPELVRDLLESDFQAVAGRILVTDGSEIPGIVADRRRIETLVRTLLERATKISRGEVEVELSHSGRELHLVVRDQGPSVALPGGVSSLEKDGTPEDLYFVRLVAELHGGRAWMESRPGQGTTVTVVLPLAQG